MEEYLHGTYYDYTVTRAGKTIRTADPYAVGCGINGARSLVVDMEKTNPEGFAEDKAPAKQKENIIYELHIKDFSYDPESGVGVNNPGFQNWNLLVLNMIDWMRKQ